MRHLLIVLALLMPAGTAVAGASEARAAPTAAPAPEIGGTVAELSDGLQTGSLLFSQGDCLAVRVYTASPYTHVAVVVMDEDRPLVYDSMNGAGVRRLNLSDYLASETPHEIHVYHPQQPLTAEQGSVLRDYLESQLGRPYAIHHHLTGRRAEGVHCAEYATDALMSVGLITAKRPSKVSPASLLTGLTRAELYESAGTVDLQPAEQPQQPAHNRCHQLWLDTKRCTSHCCTQLAAWFLCR